MLIPTQQVLTPFPEKFDMFKRKHVKEATVTSFIQIFPETNICAAIILGFPVVVAEADFTPKDVLRESGEFPA